MLALSWNIFWAVSNASGRYAQLGLVVQSAGAARATALTTVENPAEFSKKIDYAALVTSPQQTDLRTVVERLRQCTGQTTAVNIAAEPPSTVLSLLPTPEQAVYCGGRRSCSCQTPKSPIDQQTRAQVPFR